MVGIHTPEYPDTLACYGLSQKSQTGATVEVEVPTSGEELTSATFTAPVERLGWVDPPIIGEDDAGMFRDLFPTRPLVFLACRIEETYSDRIVVEVPTASGPLRIRVPSGSLTRPFVP